MKWLDRMMAATDRRPDGQLIVVYLVGAVVVFVGLMILADAVGLPLWLSQATFALLVAGLLGLFVTIGVKNATTRGVDVGPTARWLTRRAWLTAGFVSFALLAVVTAAFMLMRVGGVGPPASLLARDAYDEGLPLVFADVRNRTEEAGLGRALGAALREDLEISPVIRLADPTTVMAALRATGSGTPTGMTLDEARAVAEHEGLPAVVYAEVIQIGASYVLGARIVTAGGVDLTSARATADRRDDLLSAIDRLSARLRERVGESYRTLRGSPPLDELTTGSLEALGLYSRAWDLDAYGGSTVGAAEALEQAIVIDPRFALAHRLLGRVNEARSDTSAAIEHYGRFVALWDGEGPLLQPQVTEVRARVRRLQAGEPAGGEPGG
jgi:hypothetical protein